MTGGILTVADDLLKNDGKKFIEMMEQLAERRMQREEEAHLVASGMGHPSMRHGPPEHEDDGYDDEEDDEDYNSEEEDEFEDDEMVDCLYVGFRSRYLLTLLGGHDRGTTHGRRTKDVPNICCAYV